MLLQRAFLSQACVRLTSMLVPGLMVAPSAIVLMVFLVLFGMLALPRVFNPPVVSFMMVGEVPLLLCVLSRVAALLTKLSLEPSRVLHTVLVRVRLLMEQRVSVLLLMKLIKWRPGERLSRQFFQAELRPTHEVIPAMTQRIRELRCRNFHHMHVHALPLLLLLSLLRLPSLCVCLLL